MKREKRSTKSQDALKLQQELDKQAKRSRLKDQKEYMQNRKFQLKQQKRKEKHKGHWFCAEKEGDKLMFIQFISFFYLPTC